VWCWGDGFAGKLGNGTTTSSSVPVQVQGLSDALSVAAGSNHTCAVRADGSVACWGYNYYGTIGDGTSQNNRLVATAVSGLGGVLRVSVGGNHSCAVKSDGTAACWGRNAVGQLGDLSTTPRAIPVPVTGLDNVVELAVGDDITDSLEHTCALLTDGSVRCWGD